MSTSPIMRYLIADYLNIGTAAAPDNRLMKYFSSIEESPNAQSETIHYVSDKNATTETTKYQTQFSFTGYLQKGDTVSDFLRDIAEEQKLGVETDLYRVRLYEPVEGKDNTFYSRKFRVSPEISGFPGAGGEKVQISGNLNVIGDVTIGEFNTATLTFTPKSVESPTTASRTANITPEI